MGVGQPRLPERIGRLREIASNLWWSWHPNARQLFRSLDYPTWRLNGHNPVKQLNSMAPDRLEAVSTDESFLQLYDQVIEQFDQAMRGTNSWMAARHSHLATRQVAYFSAEYAIHNSLPIYAGGLGILAGDLCKEACDLGIGMVGIGFMYPQGYFHQHIAGDGWQQEVYSKLEFKDAPVEPVLLEGEGVTRVELDRKALYLGVWRVRLGRVELYLLDTNVEKNHPLDRDLSARLYIADQEHRIQQEMLLGIGGVRVLRNLGISPAVWHANEGHTSFMMLERIREEVEIKGVPFEEALESVRSTTVFTTHTPVPAGHDVFPDELVDKYFARYRDALGIDRERFLALGKYGSPLSDGFNMTVLALRTAGYRNAVSKLHGEVSRRMWNVLWPDRLEHEVPLIHMTNGVHGPTWMAPEIATLLAKHLCGGNISNLVERQDDASLWSLMEMVPDNELWSVHQHLKRKLVTNMDERIHDRWAEAALSPDHVLSMGALIHPEVLTIGFVRRFAEYKRPTLIFRDIDRLKSLITDRTRPVQIIFAGKSHPADYASKLLLQQAHGLARDRDFQGRIAFVEDYDMHMAHYLVQGVDVWLNTPRRLHEASGTSGMKAAINGVLHLSVLDGWWREGYNGNNGWVIGPVELTSGPPEEDEIDAAALYSLLENEVVPMYYDRDRVGLPRKWTAIMKESIKSVAPFFCARRMMKEYAEQTYVPIMEKHL